MVIATCGYGSVGTSAVLDFLRGYEDIQVVPFEFQFLHQADGISDLKYYLTQSRERISCNAAITRFRRLCFKSIAGRRIKGIVGDSYESIVNEYLSSIVCATWKGRSNYDPIDVGDRSGNGLVLKIQRSLSYMIRKVNKEANFPGYKERYYSIMTEEEFDAATRIFLSKLFSAAGIDMSKKLVLDMLFSATNPMQGSEYFDDIKILVIDRDPRDNYIASQLKKFSNKFMPADSVEHFIKYYKTSRENTIWNEKVLKVQYEDLIYHYDETSSEIIKFLGFTNRPENEFKYFDPDISVRYTNFKNSKKGFEKQVELIEKELPNHLYRFTEYHQRTDQHICEFREAFDKK